MNAENAHETITTAIHSSSHSFGSAAAHVVVGGGTIAASDITSEVANTAANEATINIVNYVLLTFGHIDITVGSLFTILGGLLCVAGLFNFMLAIYDRFFKPKL
jgi:hypothetical protein